MDCYIGIIGKPPFNNLRLMSGEVIHNNVDLLILPPFNHLFKEPYKVN